MRTDTKWVYQTHPLPLSSAAPVVAIVLVGWEFGLLRLSCVGVVRIVMAADAKKKKKRASLTFAAKLEAIQCVEDGEKKWSIAES